jgi:hypothetical protein
MLFTDTINNKKYKLSETHDRKYHNSIYVSNSIMKFRNKLFPASYVNDKEHNFLKIPELEFCKNGRLVGNRHYGPFVINAKKNREPTFIINATAESYDSAVTESYCVVC